MEPQKETSLSALKKAMEKYSPIQDQTWEGMQQLCQCKPMGKGEYFVRQGDVPRSFGFVYSGLLRAYVSDEKGAEYNKIFFPELTFPGSMVALLTNAPSHFSIEALEESYVIEMDFKAYRRLLEKRDDLKWFYIQYLEKNWLIDKEQREVALVQETAAERYLSFKKSYPALEKRISQYHIASHLGVTATQLSRIRKNLPESEKN